MNDMIPAWAAVDQTSRFAPIPSSSRRSPHCTSGRGAARSKMLVGASMHRLGYSFEQRIASFWSKVNKDGPIPPHHLDMTNCWIWEGCMHPDGYGTFSIGGTRIEQRNRYAHRVAYFLLNGCWPEPEGDHLCHVRLCVRPDHIRPATRRENAQNRAIKICVRGHPLADPNLYYYTLKGGPQAGRRMRRCKLCMPIQMKAWQEKRRKTLKA